MKPSIKPVRRRALLAQQRRALRALLDAGGVAEGASGGVPTLDPDTTRVLTDDTDRHGRSSAFYTNPRTKRGRPGALETAGPSETASDGQDHPPIRTKVSRLFASRKRLVWRPVTEGAPPQDANVGPTSVPPPRSSNVFDINGRPLELDGKDWAFRLRKEGNSDVPVGNLANVILILTHDPVWKDAFWLDEFTDSIVARKPLPFPVRSRWNDSHEGQITAWLQREMKMTVSKDTVRDALRCIVEDKRFHAVAAEFDEYATTVGWDCHPRIDRWLIDYCGAMDTPFARMVGAKFILSLVARQYDPGCKVDTVLVFEGGQGNKKSSICRALAGPGRFFDDTINLESRDTATVLRGKIIVEFQELPRFTRDPKRNELFKVFVRKREDEHVHKWERHARVSKRSWVGMATTNPDAYLSDETGTRTIWPIPVDTRVPVGPIERDRAQLLAEAVVRYKWYLYLRSQLPPGVEEDELPTEVRWWLVGEEEELAKVEQAKRFEVGVWDTHIRQMMANVNSLSVDEILESIHARSAPSGSRARALAAERAGTINTVHDGTRNLRSKDKWSKGQQNEVIRVLKHHGWIRRCLGSRNNREWRYWRPGTWRDMEQFTPGRRSAMEIELDEPTTSPIATDPTESPADEQE